MSRRDGLLGYVVTNRLYCGFIGFDNNDDDDNEDQSVFIDRHTAVKYNAQ